MRTGVKSAGCKFDLTNRPVLFVDLIGGGILNDDLRDKIANPALVQQLDQELTRMARAQYDTPEFKLMFSTPLTLERARRHAILTVYYGINRRDCWAYVQARSPYAVKKTIWDHEKDELSFDQRGGADHQTLQLKEAKALGLTREDVVNYELPPLVATCFHGWLHIAATFPWLGVLTAFHALERRNSDKLIPGGGISRRWRDKLVNEAGVPRKNSRPPTSTSRPMSTTPMPSGKRSRPISPMNLPCARRSKAPRRRTKSMLPIAPPAR